MATSLLTLEQVTRSYPLPEGELTVLEAVSLTLDAGHTAAVVGPSGSGKSTLLNIIGALDEPTSGTVRLGDTVVTALPAAAQAAFRCRQVGFVFQDHHLLPQLTATENVLLPALAAGPTAAAQARATELLQRVGLAARRDAFPARMSGGERQRVALARALINGPQLLLADEPTGNLDQETGAQVIDLLLELARSESLALLMVTHNLEHARRCDRVLQLRDGHLTPWEPGQ